MRASQNTIFEDTVQNLEGFVFRPVFSEEPVQVYGLTGMYSSDVLKTENPELTPGAWPDPIPCCPCLSVAVCMAGIPDSFDAIFTVGDTVQFKNIYTPPKDGIQNYVHHFPGGSWTQVQLPWGKQYGQLWMQPKFPIANLINHYKFFGCPVEASQLPMHQVPDDVAE